MATKVASQWPQARFSELEVDELIGVSVPKLDQDRDRHEPKRGGNAIPGPFGKSRDDVLARRQQEGAQCRNDNRRGADDTLEIGQLGKSAIDVHRSEEHTSELQSLRH